jgi:hypothetical protein
MYRFLPCTCLVRFILCDEHTYHHDDAAHEYARRRYERLRAKAARPTSVPRPTPVTPRPSSSAASTACRPLGRPLGQRHRACDDSFGAAGLPSCHQRIVTASPPRVTNETSHHPPGRDDPTVTARPSRVMGETSHAERNSLQHCRTLFRAPCTMRAVHWVLAHLIHSSAVRLPHGALAISAHLRCAAVYDGDLIRCSYSGRDCASARVGRSNRDASR